MVEGVRSPETGLAYNVVEYPSISVPEEDHDRACFHEINVPLRAVLIVPHFRLERRSSCLLSAVIIIALPSKNVSS